MRHIQYFVYILLCVQLTIHNAFALDITVPSRQNTNHVNYLKNLTWECGSDDECTATGSVCSNNVCQCTPGYIFNADMTSCIKVATGLYDSCEETSQCSAYLFSGARCIDNVCVCAPGYYYLYGRCNRYVGLFEKCKRGIDCYVNADFEASTCDMTEGICKCSPGFYQREYRTCRRRGNAVGEECTVDIDCTFSNSSYCNKFSCAMKSETKNNIDLTSDVALIVNNDLMEEQIRVGSNCTTNEQCNLLGNAVCDLTGTCRCKRAHSASNNDTKCFAELGEPCRKDDVINIKKSICRNGRWSCMSGRVMSKDNRECLKAILKYNNNCRRNEQCYVFGPDAVCSNKKCICNENSRYMESELFCWGNKGYGEACVQARDCYVKDFKGKLICKNGTCNCPDGTRLNNKGLACIDSSTDLGGVCEVDVDCVTPNSVCKKEVCTCADNYYQLNDQCLAGINSTCANNENCTPKNSECTSNICTCKSDYVSVATNSCMPILSYGEPCLLDIQCSANVSGAICTSVQENKGIVDMAELPGTWEAESKICSCSEKNHYTFGRCFTKRLLGETCTKLGECYLSSDQDKVICMNGRCTCDWGYVKSNDDSCAKASRVVLFSDNGVMNVVPMRCLSIILSAVFVHNLIL